MEVTIKELTFKLKELERKKSKAEIKAETVVFFFPNYFKKKREEARRNFWTEVRRTWPELSHLNPTLRYDDAIAFKPYTEED